MDEAVPLDYMLPMANRLLSEIKSRTASQGGAWQTMNRILKIRTLGCFEVHRGDELISAQAWPQRKTQQLLKLFLTERGHFFTQDQLIEALFPELGLDKAVRSLRSRISELRHVLELGLTHGSDSHFILHTGLKGYTFNKDADCWIDTDEFQREIEEAQNAQQAGRWAQVLEHCEKAVTLYQGDFLPEDVYEEWAIGPRERLVDLYLQTLIRLAECHARFRQLPRAIECCRKVLERQPWHEGTSRQKMLYHYHAGEESVALQVYQNCLSALQTHLQVEPSAETRALYEHILRHEAPPLPQLYPHNLPAALTNFIGREREITKIKQLLTAVATGRSPLHRLVTLTGAGGCGKTRLALQIATRLVKEYPDGVWLVELASLMDPALIPQTVAAALNVKEQPGRPLIETILDQLRLKNILLVLDNCEHLLDACTPLVKKLLEACPSLQILATSREALGMAGETVWTVPPLAVPNLEKMPPPKILQQYEAVSLFIERVLASELDFELTPQNASAIVQICRQLDGMPLAIELAAARVKVFSVEQVAARLDDRFKLLTEGNRAAIPRHQTLQAVMDWSWDLLSGEERTLLRRLSVFADGFMLEAAECVCVETPTLNPSPAQAGEGSRTAASLPCISGGERVEGQSGGLNQSEILNLLTHLVNKSLVSVKKRGKDARYLMLETVRQYSSEKLREAEEAEIVRQRHLDWCLALVERAEPELQGADQSLWLERLEQEHDNVRAALAWSLQSKEIEKGLRLVSIFWRFWYGLGYLSEGRQWLEKILEASTDAPAALRAKALNGLGGIVHNLREPALARALYEKSLALQRELGNRRSVAVTLINLGSLSCDQGDYAGAQAYLAESLLLSREIADGYLQGYALNHLGRIAFEQGDYRIARSHYEEGLPLLRKTGNKPGIAWILNNLGAIANSAGNHAGARPYLEESFALHREVGNKQGMALALDNLGLNAQAQKAPLEALAFHQESLTLFRELGDRQGIVYGLEGLASVANTREHAEQATRLLGAAEALRESIGFSLPPRERAIHETKISAARGKLNPTVFAKAWAEGRAMTLEQAIEYALQKDAHRQRSV